MSRDLTLYLDDTLKAITLIRSFTHGMTFQEFKDDVRTQRACIRELEVIGEAVGHVPDSDRQSVPEVEWRKIKGLRNVLIHEYFGVDIEIGSVPSSGVTFRLRDAVAMPLPVSPTASLVAPRPAPLQGFPGSWSVA